MKLKEQLEGRVSGGEKVELGEIPYQVYMEVCSMHKCGSCGGSLISEWYVLSAGHCFCTNCITSDWDNWEDKPRDVQTNHNRLRYKSRSYSKSPKNKFSVNIYAGVTERISQHAIKRTALKTSVKLHPNWMLGKKNEFGGIELDGNV